MSVLTLSNHCLVIFHWFSDTEFYIVGSIYVDFYKCSYTLFWDLLKFLRNFWSSGSSLWDLLFGTFAVFCFRLIISYYCGKTLHVQYPINFEIFQPGGWEHALWLSLCEGRALLFPVLQVVFRDLRHICWSVISQMLKGSSLIIWNSLSVHSNALFYAKLVLKH